MHWRGDAKSSIPSPCRGAHRVHGEIVGRLSLGRRSCLGGQDVMLLEETSQKSANEQDRRHPYDRTVFFRCSSRRRHYGVSNARIRTASRGKDRSVLMNLTNVTLSRHKDAAEAVEALKVASSLRRRCSKSALARVCWDICDGGC